MLRYYRRTEIKAGFHGIFGCWIPMIAVTSVDSLRHVTSPCRWATR